MKYAVAILIGAILAIEQIQKTKFLSGIHEKKTGGLGPQEYGGTPASRVAWYLNFPSSRSIRWHSSKRALHRHM